MVALTSHVTDGTANAINHLYVSTDGNYLVGQRAETSVTPNASRAVLNNANEIFAVTNVTTSADGSDTFKTYQDLVESWGFGVVTDLGVHRPHRHS